MSRAARSFGRDRGPRASRAGASRARAGRARDAAASVADLGTIIPLFAALIVLNGVDAGAAFLVAGALFAAAGLFYGVPVPVQPIKAAGAIAIATGASPAVIAGAGLVLGALLLLVAVTGLAPLLVRLFPKPIIRGNQLGVGILLVATSIRLVDGGAVAWIVFGALVGVLVAGSDRAAPVALMVVAGGVAMSVLSGERAAVAADPALPGVALPAMADLRTAFWLLVIPQLPLTLGNAVVGTSDLMGEYYGRRARRVSVRNLLLTCGAANVAAGAVGGIPLCHGSSGATAYHRFGGRTGMVGVTIGAAFLVVGGLFASSAVAILELIPAVALAALLAVTGVRHAGLASDQRGRALLVAVVMGVAGGATRNLMLGMAVGLPLYAFLIGVPKAMTSRATRPSAPAARV
ncbi:MAG TPA: molybdate transporter family protein [Actinomycetota bacterium]